MVVKKQGSTPELPLSRGYSAEHVFDSPVVSWWTVLIMAIGTVLAWSLGGVESCAWVLAAAAVVIAAAWPWMAIAFLLAGAPHYVQVLTGLPVAGTGAGFAMTGLLGYYFLTRARSDIRPAINAAVISQALLWALMEIHRVPVATELDALKAHGFLSRGVLPFVALSLLAARVQHYRSAEVVFIATATVATAVGLWGGAKISPEIGGRLWGLHINPIWYGRLAGFVILACCWGLTVKGLPLFWRIVCAVFIAVGSVAVMASGARQVLPALGMAIAVLLLLVHRGQRVCVAMAALGVGCALLVSMATLPEETILRFRQIIVPQGLAQAMAVRVELWRGAMGLFLESPVLGWGTGRSTSQLGLCPWPHNILLEFAAEHGLLGLALLLCTPVLVLARAVPILRRPPSQVFGRDHVVLWVAAWVFYFIVALQSGYSNTNAEFWVSLAFLWGAAQLARSREVPPAALTISEQEGKPS